MFLSSTRPQSLANLFYGRVVSLVSRGMAFEVVLHSKGGVRITASVLSSALVSGNIRVGGMLDELQPRIHSCFQAVHTKNGGAGNMNRNRKFSAVFGVLLLVLLCVSVSSAAEKVTVYHAGSLSATWQRSSPCTRQPTRAWTFSGESGGSAALARKITDLSGGTETCSSQRTTW